ncbi:MAG: amidase family protein [Erythrobacter sp.]|jgi:amidase|nr:amidase family protein [Erythrobacter sp.]
MAYPQLTDKPGALETAAAIARGELSVAEAVDAAITRFERDDATINALAVPDFERACDTARKMDAKGPIGEQPLFGVPMTVKESFDVAGLPTCWGHERFADLVPRRDADVVRRVKAAGAVILGKTNVPVDLADWQSFNPVYGRTCNPHDLERSPGGSSGGGAAAVASGMVACEYGSDIGGSVRVPAHFCGIWGHKTTEGLVLKRGHDHPMMAQREGFLAGHESPLSIAGPLARSPEDLAILVRIGAQYALNDPGLSLKDARILAITRHPLSVLDRSVGEPVQRALAELERAGLDLAFDSDLLPDLEAQHGHYLRMLNTIMARGGPAPGGKRASASDWFDMLDAQAEFAARWARLFDAFDIVLAPPAPVLAVAHSDRSVFEGTLMIDGKETSGGAALAWSGIATYPGLPATVLPIGEGTYEGARLPCGLQVIGPRMGDLATISAAREIAHILHS